MPGKLDRAVHRLLLDCTRQHIAFPVTPGELEHAVCTGAMRWPGFSVQCAELARGLKCAGCVPTLLPSKLVKDRV